MKRRPVGQQSRELPSLTKARRDAMLPKRPPTFEQDGPRRPSKPANMVPGQLDLLAELERQGRA